MLFVISLSSASCANDTDTSSTIEKVVSVEAPADSAMSHGEEAHNNHCYKCHTDEIYTRGDRFVQSIDELSQQVARCQKGSNIPWLDEDTNAVVQFLNKKYYKF